VTRPVDRTRRCAALLCVIGLVLAACGPLPTPSAAQTAEPVATTDPAVGWTRINVPDPGGAFTDVATTPSGLVVVGPAGPAAQLTRFWASPDGLAWAVEHLPSDGRTPSLIIPWNDLVVAIGSGVSNRCAHPTALGSWLGTADGGWLEAPWHPIFCAGATATAAAATDHVVVAGSGFGDRPFLWFSDNGLRWTNIPFPRDVGSPRAVASVGGTDVLMGARLDGGVWVSLSRDGTTWSDPVPLVAPPGADVLALVPLGEGLIALVRDGSGVGAYASADGVTWSSTPAVGLDANQVARVVAVEGALVALGGDEARPAMWVSTDGTSWRPVVVPAEVAATGSLRGITVRDDMVYLVGQVEIESEAVAGAWAAPAP
jgi:hypothetical protein